MTDRSAAGAIPERANKVQLAHVEAVHRHHLVWVDPAGCGPVALEFHQARIRGEGLNVPVVLHLNPEASRAAIVNLDYQ